MWPGFEKEHLRLPCPRTLGKPNPSDQLANRLMAENNKLGEMLGAFEEESNQTQGYAKGNEEYCIPGF